MECEDTDRNPPINSTEDRDRGNKHPAANTWINHVWQREHSLTGEALEQRAELRLPGDDQRERSYQLALQLSQLLLPAVR